MNYNSFEYWASTERRELRSVLWISSLVKVNISEDLVTFEYWAQYNEFKHALYKRQDLVKLVDQWCYQYLRF